ncbi:MAG: LysR family transcriptional regulator [Oligosphaeraceae bacterium]
MTFRQLAHFLALGETLHFARAAQRLHISTSALSVDIQRLERELGCQLIDRSDKWNIRLTAAGDVYHAKVRTLLELLEEARHEAVRASRGESGRLTVALLRDFCRFLDLAELFRRFNREYPGISLTIHDIPHWRDMRQALLDGSCDVGFLFVISPEQQLADLESLSLGTAPICLALSTRHPLARRESPPTAQELADCHFILPPDRDGNIFRLTFDQLFLDHCGRLPAVAQEATSYQASMQLAAANLGIALVPTLGDPPSQPDLAIRQLPFDFHREAVLAWNGHLQSAQRRHFLDLAAAMRLQHKPDLP